MSTASTEGAAEGTRQDKILPLPGYTEGYTAATYCIKDEDHTLGNLLRWMLMKDPDVEFCGYSAPHPSEAKIHLRIQMYDNKSSLEALKAALLNLEQMTEAILDAYNESLKRGEFERYEEPSYDFESVNDRLWAQKEAEGRGSRAEWEQQKREKQEAEAAKLVKPKKEKKVKKDKS
ncbi:RNA polymerase subunit AC19 [Microbotryomycetes sp. JL221]|nr:RNA polymerase subunit AC19 [Microbotryomycetes sp. JL221]